MNALNYLFFQNTSVQKFRAELSVYYYSVCLRFQYYGWQGIKKYVKWPPVLCCVYWFVNFLYAEHDSIIRKM